MPHDGISQEKLTLDSGSLGWLEGIILSSSSGKGIRYFGGVPYALPPVGPYRFRQARPLPDHFRYGTKANPGRFTKSTAVCPQPAWLGEVDERLWDEDCLQLNISIPNEAAPIGGFPVFFYIHGGFLQWGSPNLDPTVLTTLLGETAFKAIVVAPAYRVNAFGFLTSKELLAEANAHGEPAGNMGFFDQRKALEWTARNIGAFGGNSSNITVGGYSAGSHSTFQQLAHELYFVPKEKAVIKRVIMWSNSPGVQPKSLQEQQKQFDELLTALKIPLSLSATEKLQRLREISPQDLVSVQSKLKLSEFRGCSDGHFISKSLIANINNGDFAKRMKARGIRIMNGECRDEHNLYRAWRTPDSTYEAVYTRLCADYPEQVVQKLMRATCGDKKNLPAGYKDWKDAFGRFYANLQVHCLERGFLQALTKGGLESGKDLFRYRFDWRTKACDAAFPPDWGVTHSSDMDIWFWGLFGKGLTASEKEILKPWNEAFADFVKGELPNWRTTTVTEMCRLREDGVTDIWEDDRWAEGLQIWDIVNGQEGAGLLGWIKAKL